MKKQKKDSDRKETKKASDSKTSNLEITESEEEMFTQEDFEDALRRVSRRICEPDEEKIRTSAQ